MKQSTIISNTLHALWRVWAISFGVIALILGTCHSINKTLLPALVLVLVYLLTALMRARRGQDRQSCHRLAWVSQTTLVISALVMFVLVLLHNPHLFGNRFNAPYFNPKIPYITGIVIFTVGALVSAYAMIMGRNIPICRSCRKIYGEYADDSLASSLFDEESRRQLHLFFWICLLTGGAQWAYYYIFFINVNFNSPDLFFFNYLPVAVYLLSLLYIGSRYYNIADAFRATITGSGAHADATELRYIVTCGDDMLLRRQDDDVYDTPYKLRVGNVKVDESQAEERFTALGGAADTNIRKLYDSATRGGVRCAHFAAFATEESKERMKRGGTWMSAYEVDKLLHSGLLAPMLANELVRIYTITMAWKTYDRTGRRLYPIKHYKPMFHLRDLKEWDVDYNDTSWLQIAADNEDARFFRLRRAWRRCLDIFKHR